MIIAAVILAAALIQPIAHAHSSSPDSHRVNLNRRIVFRSSNCARDNLRAGDRLCLGSRLNINGRRQGVD